MKFSGALTDFLLEVQLSFDLGVQEVILVGVQISSCEMHLGCFWVVEQSKYDIWAHREEDFCSQGLNACWQEVSEVDLMAVQDSASGETVDLGRDCGGIEVGAETAGVLMLDAGTAA